MTEKLFINGRFLTQAVTGVQRVGIEFCNALEDLLQNEESMNLDVEILVPHSALVTQLNLRRIRVREVGRLRGHLWEQFELPWAARRGILLSLGNTAPLASLIFAPSRMQVMVHDLSYRYFPDAYSRSFRHVYELIIPVVLSRAASVITVSESERAAILREYPELRRPERLVAAQNGSNPSLDVVIAEREARDRNCLYVGSLTKRKNADGLIAAAIQLARDHDVKFTFVGSTGASFEGISIEIPDDVAEQIVFLGQINDPIQLAQLYAKSAVFVFPSFYEASPLPPIEAMAYGTPVVASDIPSLRERCGEAALYCDPNEVQSIVAQTVHLLDSRQIWKLQQAAGIARSDEFSWSEQARTILAHLPNTNRRA